MADIVEHPGDFSPVASVSVFQPCDRDALEQTSVLGAGDVGSMRGIGCAQLPLVTGRRSGQQARATVGCPHYHSDDLRTTDVGA